VAESVGERRRRDWSGRKGGEGNVGEPGGWAWFVCVVVGRGDVRRVFGRAG